MNKCPKCGLYMFPHVEQTYNGFVLIWKCPCGFSTEFSDIHLDNKTKMRDETQQKRDSINNYIEKISVKTGVSFFDLMQDLPN